MRATVELKPTDSMRQMKDQRLYNTINGSFDGSENKGEIQLIGASDGEC